MLLMLWGQSLGVPNPLEREKSLQLCPYKIKLMRRLNECSNISGDVRGKLLRSDACFVVCVSEARQPRRWQGPPCWYQLHEDPQVASSDDVQQELRYRDATGLAKRKDANKITIYHSSISKSRGVQLCPNSPVSLSIASC